jgi:hypothetical protein
VLTRRLQPRHSAALERKQSHIASTRPAAGREFYSRSKAQLSTRDIYLTQVGEDLRRRARTGLSTRVAPSDATDAAAAAPLAPTTAPQTPLGLNLTQIDIPSQHLLTHGSEALAILSARHDCEAPCAIGCSQAALELYGHLSVASMPRPPAAVTRRTSLSWTRTQRRRAPDGATRCEWRHQRAWRPARVSAATVADQELADQLRACPSPGGWGSALGRRCCRSCGLV